MFEFLKAIFPVTQIFKEFVKIVKIYLAKFKVAVFNKFKIMKLLWIKGKYIQTSSFNLKLFWKKVTYQIWTFQAALRERLIQRKNF